MRNKQTIVNAAEAGLELDPRDVARVGMNRRHITLRHAWPEDTDARVWAGVRRAFTRLAKALAAGGRSIDVNNSDGTLIETYEPEDYE